MFGWEFPPHIAGGLGTACYGMTRGLARNDVDVTFVVPHAYGDEDQRFTHVMNASDVEALYGSTGSGADDILEKCRSSTSTRTWCPTSPPKSTRSTTNAM